MYEIVVLGQVSRFCYIMEHVQFNEMMTNVRFKFVPCA